MNVGTSQITKTEEISVSYDHGRLLVIEGNDSIDVRVDTQADVIRVILTGSTNVEREVTFSELYELLKP